MAEWKTLNSSFAVICLPSGRWVWKCSTFRQVWKYSTGLTAGTLEGFQLCCRTCLCYFRLGSEDFSKAQIINSFQDKDNWVCIFFQRYCDRFLCAVLVKIEVSAVPGKKAEGYARHLTVSSACVCWLFLLLHCCTQLWVKLSTRSCTSKRSLLLITDKVCRLYIDGV